MSKGRLCRHQPKECSHVMKRQGNFTHMCNLPGSPLYTYLHPSGQETTCSFWMTTVSQTNQFLTR